MAKHGVIIFFMLLAMSSFGQLFVARDTLTVFENNYVLKMPWANGINHSNVSSMDVDGDGKKDVVVFDRVNQYGVGRFRCFLNNGNAGDIKFKAAPELSYYFPQVANWALLVDYNCDSLEDIFCSTSLGVMVYKNTTAPGAHVPGFTLAKSLLYCDYNPTGTPAIYNLYASSIGVPGIADVDNDGDLDIITFSAGGAYMELYKNMRAEKQYSCDSLVFEFENSCWGKVSEGSCQVEFNNCGPLSSSTPTTSPIAKTYHAGSCLTCIDSDGDMDQDIILGDIVCDVVQYIHNTGTPGNLGAFFTDTTKLYPNYPNKGSTQQIKMNLFPCAYYVDVNDDGKKDLIATPNVPTGENYKSVWYYKNTSVTNTVNFQFVKSNFLQDEMIEVGQNSFPVVFDYNNDHKMDLLIGNYGYFTNNVLQARLTLYENTGTLSKPSYSLITRDYANLSAQALNNAMPTVGDIDGDGDVDICIGTSSGQIHWMENTAGPNNVCNFSVFKNNPFLFTTNSAAAAPQLFDINNDGKLDLLIGTKSGRISYYKNTGTTSVPAYSLITDYLGNVDVKNSVDLFGIEGYAVPYFFREGTETKLLTGSVNGTIFYYTVPSDITTPFSLISPSANGFNEGGQSTICFEDVTNDGKRDLFIGNASGGLSFFSSQGPNVGIAQISSDELKTSVSLFPNPAEDVLSIRIDKLEFSSGKLIITDLLGKELQQVALRHNSETFSIAELHTGIYFVTVSLITNTSTVNTTQKIIKNN